MEETVTASSSDEVIEDFLELLRSYGGAPFSILEKNLDNVKESMKQEVHNFLSESRWEWVYADAENVFEQLHRETEEKFPWKMILFMQTGGAYVKELKRELGNCALSDEIIYAAARSEANSDVLFYLPGDIWRIYRLTHSENTPKLRLHYWEFPDIQSALKFIKENLQQRNL